MIRSRRLPDTPPLSPGGVVVLGVIVGLALAGRALDHLPDPSAALWLARALRFRRIR